MQAVRRPLAAPCAVRVGQSRRLSGDRAAAPAGGPEPVWRTHAAGAERVYPSPASLAGSGLPTRVTGKLHLRGPLGSAAAAACRLPRRGPCTSVITCTLIKNLARNVRKHIPEMYESVDTIHEDILIGMQFF